MYSGHTCSYGALSLPRGSPGWGHRNCCRALGDSPFHVSNLACRNLKRNGTQVVTV